MVEVFKTNIKLKKEARPLVKQLAERFPEHRINFDLEDRDKILRVEGANISSKRIIQLLNKQGFQCTILH